MTNAWLQRLINLGVLTLTYSLAAWLWDSQRAWATVCLLAPWLLTPLILGIQCVWAAQINRAETLVHPASLRQWLKAWLAEWRVATQVFAWWQPFRYRAIADHLKSSPSQRGMVLVHGFFCNRALWTDWMRQLHSRQRAFVSVDLEPAYGSISDYSDVVEAAIRQVEKATGMPPVLVGHSMGGLAIRAWAAKYVGRDGDMKRIHHIFTLGTPHQGTAIAAASHTENGHQMRRGSPWLADNASRLPHNFAKHCTCYYSHCDNIVFPASTATISGADNRHIAGYAHVQLVFANEIQQACLGQLEN
ncbi:alpha/beta fold hydrolase [Variovorax sp. PCZ-1]|uniref:esterase/lipase family protein n=1 Tax=Variovorax sp. PCZ-1 TaxID=2835533 RepID=UPI001BCF6407|nr:alpha/beta fold hydrolase [Variovorax sp. PCZ-1]MBS7808937.1 alpha/beta fold hydrolase [Variovorax sp. PCZ-1]